MILVQAQRQSQGLIGGQRDPIVAGNHLPILQRDPLRVHEHPLRLAGRRSRDGGDTEIVQGLHFTGLGHAVTI
jgi:hypothetical protein